MRLRIITIALLAAVVAAPAADAKPIVGISDNSAAIFNDPLFAGLKMKNARLVMSWNAFSQAAKGDTELSDKVVPYLQAAAVDGIKVHIAFQHARGEPVNCLTSEGRGESQCKLPSVSAYKSEITKFLTATGGSVDTITAWNESNHNTQPTAGNPKRAGQFAKAADQVCKTLGTCSVVTMDILDSADDVRAKKLKYKATKRFIKKLKKGYGKRPARCGIHNYADVNRRRTAGTKALSKAMKCKSIWLEETGGFYEFASFWTKATRKEYGCKSAAKCQLASMKYLFGKTLKAARNIDRVYIYRFYAGDDQFDAGLIDGKGVTTGGKKRPVYNYVKKKV